MPRMIPSVMLREAANAMEAYEKADVAMRRAYPEPAKGVVEKWNRAREAAHVAVDVIKGALK